MVSGLINLLTAHSTPWRVEPELECGVRWMIVIVRVIYISIYRNKARIGVCSLKWF
jgi:hypothetical protein